MLVPTAIGVAAAFGALTVFAVGYLVADRRGRQRELANAQPIPVRARDLLIDRPSATVPVALIDALRIGECVLFAGSGLSRFVGAPSWKDILEGALAVAEREAPGTNWQRLRRYLDDDQRETDLVTDLLAARLPRERWLDLISGPRTSAPSAGSPIANLQQLPFAGAFTNAWDSAVADIFKDRDPEVVASPFGQDLAGLLYSDRFFVLHTYGAAAEPESVILNWSDFRLAVASDRTYARFLASVVASRSLLFIGATDAAIDRFFLGSEIDFDPVPSREHFALLQSADDLDLRAERLKERYGVNVIAYEDDLALRTVIDHLASLASSSRSSRRRRPRPSEAPTLKSLALTNIGPFPRLQIPLHRRCTLLVGGNGSGKTTILRALAVAVAGEGAEIDLKAGDLLRAGERTGTIELATTGATYRAILTRERTGVRVEADQYAVSEAGDWLAVGFPALRGVEAVPIKGQSLVEHVSAGDVMPLIDNGVDTRLDAVEQWIVNHALSRDRVGGKRAIDSFFERVSSLTPAYRIAFHEVDDQMKILTTTPDGPMELSQIPRGVISLLSWVGFLVTRMIDLGGKTEEWWNARGLLLIDEIDIHLHPEWQRLIAPALQRLFPQLQLIASTHSPLVVGSAAESTLIRLERQFGGVDVNEIDPSFTGLRADQILTSSAFGLETSRDLETEVKLDRYSTLLDGERTEEGDREIERLRHELLETLPEPAESPGTRAALKVVDELLAQQVAALPEDKRRDLLRATEVFLARDARLGRTRE